MYKDIHIEDFEAWDANAFHLLYKVYYKALVGYASLFLGDIASSEDVVQVLMSKIWERKATFASLHALESYMYTSVRNQCLNSIRHRDVEQSYSQQLQDQSAHGRLLDIIAEDEEETLLRERVYIQLLETIDRLPQRSREIFLLILDGKSNKEIAESLGISVETVKTHKKRSMTYLRQHLHPAAFCLLMEFI